MNRYEIILLIVAIWLPLARPIPLAQDDDVNEVQIMKYDLRRAKIYAIRVLQLSQDLLRTRQATGEADNQILIESAIPLLKRNIAIGRGDGYRPGK